MLVTLYVRSCRNGAVADIESVFHVLCECFKIVFEMLRTYNSPLCGYISNII